LKQQVESLSVPLADPALIVVFDVVVCVEVEIVDRALALTAPPMLLPVKESVLLEVMHVEVELAGKPLPLKNLATDLVPD